MTDKQEHTPGSWHWGSPHANGASPLIAADGTVILHAFGVDGNEFDDALIVAAPALVAALERIDKHGPIMGSKDEYRRGQLDILETIRGISSAALSLAKGSEVGE